MLVAPFGTQILLYRDNNKSSMKDGHSTWLSTYKNLWIAPLYRLISQHFFSRCFSVCLYLRCAQLIQITLIFYYLQVSNRWHMYVRPGTYDVLNETLPPRKNSLESDQLFLGNYFYVRRYRCPGAIATMMSMIGLKKEIWCFQHHKTLPAEQDTAHRQMPTGGGLIVSQILELNSGGAGEVKSLPFLWFGKFDFTAF